MWFRFDDKKATQAAALIVKLAGGRIPMLALIKLLYLADREALISWNRPITGDRYVSMKMGPVLSHVYDLIKGTPNEYWNKYIGPRHGDHVSLINEPPLDELSDSEETVIRAMFEKFGGMDRFSLVEYCHRLPEWQDPGHSMLPIDIETILASGGRTPGEIEAIRVNSELSREVGGFLREK